MINDVCGRNVRLLSFAVDEGVLMHRGQKGKLCRVIIDPTEKDRIAARLHADVVGGAHYGHYCGVFAAAFLFEWAVMSVRANLNVKFNLPIMRDHLVFCLDRELVIPFPKLPLTRSYKAGTTRKVRICMFVYIVTEPVKFSCASPE